MAKRSYFVTETPLEDLFRVLFDRSETRINLYCQEVHYVRYHLQDKFNRPFTLDETFTLLKEEFPDFDLRDYR